METKAPFCGGIVLAESICLLPVCECLCTNHLLLARGPAQAVGDLTSEATALGTKEPVMNTVITISFKMAFESNKNMLSILVTS